jgi:hypothetical protein
MRDQSDATLLRRCCLHWDHYKKTELDLIVIYQFFMQITQICTGHTYTGEFRQELSLEGQYECPCGEYIETRENFLLECPRYNRSRHILEKASPGISLPTILGTKKGIAALSGYRAHSQVPVHWRSPAVPRPSTKNPTRTRSRRRCVLLRPWRLAPANQVP